MQESERMEERRKEKEAGRHEEEREERKKEGKKTFVILEKLSIRLLASKEMQFFMESLNIQAK